MLDGFLFSSSVETQQLGLDTSSMVSLIWITYRGGGGGIKQFNFL